VRAKLKARKRQREREREREREGGMRDKDSLPVCIFAPRQAATRSILLNYRSESRINPPESRFAVRERIHVPGASENALYDGVNFV